MSKKCACDTIVKLKELTEKLPSFPALIEKVPAHKADPKLHNLVNELDLISSGYSEYKMDTGECFSWFIHRSGNEIAIHRWFATAGTHFPEHEHQVKEICVLYHGKVEHTVKGKTSIINVGDHVSVEPGVRHSAYFLEDSKFISITIPPEKEFPNVTR